MKKSVFILVFSLIVLLICSVTGFCIAKIGLDDQIKENTHQEEIIAQYQEYLNNCELLLDSVSGRYNDFMDNMSYTDVYYNYMRSKEKVDSILLSE